MQFSSSSERSAESRTRSAACPMGSGHGGGRFIVGVLAVLAVTAFVQSWPEIVRYIKLRRM
jgi:hypothetical protein